MRTKHVRSLVGIAILIMIATLGVAAQDQTKVLSVTYTCDPNTELKADFIKSPESKVRLRYGTQDLTLTQVRSADGAKYENEETTFWVKGNEAQLTSKSLTGTCRVSDSSSSSSANIKTVLYRCEPDVDLTADFDNNEPQKVRIRFGTQDLTLPHVVSADGAKYQDGATVFWTKGPAATLESKALNAQCREKQRREY